MIFKQTNLLLLMAVISFTLLLPSIFAEQQSMGVFKQGSCVNLIQTCSNCSFVNITITDPNSTVVISNDAMTKTDTIFNYSFCNTSLLGQYIYNTKGDVDGVMTTVPVNFIITPSGFQVSVANTIVMFFIVGIISIITIFMYWFGITNKSVPLKLFFLSFSILLTIFIIGYVLNIANIGIGEFSNLTGVFNSIYILGTILVIAGSIVAVVFVIKFSFEQFYKSKGYEFGEINVG